MKIFHCDHCEQLVFFENTQCVSCGHVLAFLPDLFEIGSLEAAGDQLWRSPLAASERHTYRLCENYRTANVCNWAIPSDDVNSLCSSCRLTRVVPNLSQPGNQEAWYRLEVAKRRLVYNALSLRLPLRSKTDDAAHGLAFEFVADPPGPDNPPALTGHAHGVISINVAEADDAEREKRRLALHEPYRTLLGHFRHESGHYYWDRLVNGTDRIDCFREMFGDERRDYARALQEHYANGPAPDWQQRFVTVYASSHPWEDWAETWAHYLHMTDTLETAAACGVSLKPTRPDEPSLKTGPAAAGTLERRFDRLIDSWYPLTYMLNSLNRGMGFADAYPFVLSTPAVEKLRAVHEIITAGDPERT
jgi:hypothetical protein